MDIAKQHHVDASERDAAGMYEYYYSYWLFSFREGNVTLIARSYDDEPHQAHFLRKDVGENMRFFTTGDLASPLFAAACNYLRCVEAKTAIAVLRGDGYQEIKPADE